jgi:hypothetical protein
MPDIIAYSALGIMAEGTEMWYDNPAWNLNQEA